MTYLRHSPRLVLFVLASIALGVAPGLQATARSRTPDSRPGPSPADRTEVERVRGSAERYGALPLRFEANVGQTDGRVRFLARGGGYTLFLTPDEAVFSLSARAQSAKASPEQSLPAGDEPRQRAVLRMRMDGANLDPGVAGEGELEGHTNYFVGNDPSRWYTDVRGYASVRYRDVYPGIDLVYYGKGGALEYDFVVAPGADPRQITLDFEGAERVEIDANGELVLGTAAGDVRQHAPVLYQETPKGRVAVEGGFEPRGDQSVGFGFAAYDSSAPLVIDPVLVYSTYLGSSGGETPNEIVVDSSGAAYVVGSTGSADFPTAGAFDPSANGSDDVFVTKLNAAGNGLVYSTYLGGEGSDGSPPVAIAVDSLGAAYVVGRTDSPNFPLLNALDTTLGGGQDAFVAKLSPAGNALVYSTYLGGSGAEWGTGITVDATGAAYIAGYGDSTNFPTVNAFDTTLGGGVDAFVSKFSPAGDALVYSTYLGGGGNEFCFDIATDAAGAAYVEGHTTSSNFPTASAFDATLGGSQDLFVTKFSSAGNALVYSTYLGGSGSESAIITSAIAVDSTGAAYVTANTTSTNYPTANAFDATFGGASDAVVTKFSPAGNTLVYSTYLGGSGFESSAGVAVDSTGAAYVMGTTFSSNFPTVDANDATLGGGSDAFVTKFSPAGNTLVYSTYYGGGGSESGYGLALDSTGAAYITGFTSSTDLPTASAYDTTIGGTSDAFVAKFEGSGAPAPGSDTAGVYVASSSAWFLRNSNSPGPANLVFGFGGAPSTSTPLAGDWDGDGDDTAGLYDPATGAFFLRNTSSAGPADVVFTFGAGGAGLVPVTGDWDGDGDDTVGIYDPTTGAFFLRNSNTNGGADVVFTFGGGVLVPVTGDWDGDGDDTIGLYDPATGFFFLRNSSASGPADLTFSFGAGGATPVTGDWNGDGTDTIGIYDGASGAWFLRNTNASGSANIVFTYGPAESTPLTGDWDGQ